MPLHASCTRWRFLLLSQTCCVIDCSSFVLVHSILCMCTSWTTIVASGTHYTPCKNMQSTKSQYIGVWESGVFLDGTWALQDGSAFNGRFGNNVSRYLLMVSHVYTYTGFSLDEQYVKWNLSGTHLSSSFRYLLMTAFRQKVYCMQGGTLPCQ